MKTKGFRCSLAFNKCRGSSSGSKAYLSVALIEPLESPLRALFGHPQRGLITVAATEPLGSSLRALFGHPQRGLTTIAVTEPLETPLRALFGHPQRGLTTIAVIEPLEGIIRSDKRRKKKNHKQGNVYPFSNDFSRTGNTLASRSIYPVINDFSRMGKNRRQKKRWHPRAISYNYISLPHP